MREPTTVFDYDARESLSEATYAARCPRTVQHLEHQHAYVKQDGLLRCDCGATVGPEDAS